MLIRKTYINNCIVVFAAVLACSAIIISRESRAPAVPISAIVEAQLKTENSSISSVNGSISTVNSPETTTQVPLTTIVDQKEEIKINTYVIKSGDTVASIAASLSLKPDTVAASNGLSVSSALKDGQVIDIPSVDGVVYKLKDEDTLWDLAVLNKVDLDELLEINKIDAPEKLAPGKKIIIPGVFNVKSVASDSGSSKKSSTSKTFASRGSMPTSGTITSKFGRRWGKHHAGIDIAAPKGTNVYAFMDGEVVFSGWESGYGNLVIIDHGNGLESYYGHNSKLLVKVGQTVKKGTHIAEVGSTGNSTGPHCHFEVRKNGTPVNPLNYVK